MTNGETDEALIAVRADGAGFLRDVAEMRSVLEGSLVAAADKAGRGIETALLRGLRTGRFGFEDLKRVALSTLNEIAAATIRNGLGSLGSGIFGGSSAGGGFGGGSGGGLISLGLSLLSAFAGAPGRATGGPVSPQRPYWVGERGPELFVPTASGRIEPAGTMGARDIRVAITVIAPMGGSAPQALAQSSRQIARAVRGALQD